MSTDHTPNPAMLATKLASLAAVLAMVVGAMVLVGWAFDIAVLRSILPGWVSMKANASVCFTGTLAGLLIFMAVIFRLNSFMNERKKAEAALREKELLLLESQRIAHIGSWRFDLSGQLSWSDEAYRIYGVSPDTFTPNVESLLNLIHPDDRLAMQAWIGACVADKKPDALEFRITLPDGTVRILNGYGELQHGAGNSPSHLIGIVHDITERKQVETALRESEAEFHTLAEAMPQIVWITRPDGWNIYFNQQWMDYTGLTLEESMGHGWNKPFHPDDQQQVWNAWQQATATGGIYSVESRLRRADGIYRWWLVRGVPLKDTNGNILKWIGTCTDIHDMKMAELEVSRINQELRESERRFSDLLKNVELVSVMRDREERITYCNEFLLRLTGWQYEEIIGRNWVELFVPPEITEQKKNFFAELLLDKPETRHHESEILTRSGERRLIHWNNSVLRSAEGDVIGTASIGEDITERKRAGEALRMAEQQQRQLAENLEIERSRLVTAQRIAKIGSWETNLATMSVRWSDETHRIHETDPATFQPAHQSFLDLVHPEDRARVDEALARSIAGGAASAIEHRLFMPDKRIKFVEERWQVSFDTQGVPIRAIGTCQDITERKQAEEKLAEQLEELRRWHEITSGREKRILVIKHEVNELLAQAGQPPRYPSAELSNAE